MADPTPDDEARKSARIIPRRMSFIRRVEETLVRADERAKASGRRRLRIPVYVARILFQVVRQWIRDRCPQQAASLAFQTVLSIVPALGVALAALRATGNTAAESTFVEFIAGDILPVSRAEVSERLVAWSKNITFQSMGAIGLVVAIILAFVMFNNLERVANDIWRSERRRSIAQKFVVFYFSITVGPFLFGLSLVEAAKFGLTSGGSGFFLSLLSSFALLFLANYSLPANKVRVVPALVGAAVTTVLFEIAKFGFNLYVVEIALPRFSGIYGAVAIAPLWLLWVYWGWVMLLLGMEIAHAAQNLRFLERVDRRTEMSVDEEVISRVNGTVAARIMVMVAEAYIRGEPAVSEKSLVDAFELSEGVVERITDRLQRAELLARIDGQHTGFVPSRPPSKIALAEVMAVFRGDDVTESPARSGADPLDEVLKAIDADLKQRAGSITLADLAQTTDPGSESATDDK